MWQIGRSPVSILDLRLLSLIPGQHIFHQLCVLDCDGRNNKADNMKAIVCDKYGSPDVLHIDEIAKPVLGDKDLCVKIHASSVNALDWHFLRGKPFLVRLQYGLFKPKNRVLGYDFSGTVEEVGQSVTQFKPGDEVFGGLGFGLGAFAEYATVSEDGFVALKPANMSFEEAASVPAAAVAALYGLQDKGNIQAGQKVLINGAAGGVGTFSVQIAKSFDTEVTGVCSTKNLEMVSSLGADKVIDYTKQDFTAGQEAYDLILDNVGNHTVKDLERILKPSGICFILGFTSMRMMLLQSLQAPGVSKSKGKTITPASSEVPSKKQLLFLKELLENRMIHPAIDRRYVLEDAADAVAYLETGHARAKVVITI